MIRVEITNYESIEHAIVEVDGFTTMQGPNYTGKSAIMRAINAALTNQSGMGFISWWGAMFCEVKIQGEGFDILWHKEEGNNFYCINGTTYTKIGDGKPPDELNSLGFGTVSVNDVRHNLHYADQFDTLFLVDEQNTKGTDLITSAYGLDRLYKAQELCSKDQKSSQSLLKIRKKDLEFVTSDLKKFEGLDDAIKAGDTLKAERDRLVSDEHKITLSKKWLASMIQAATESNKLKGATVVKVPEADDLAESCRRCGSLSTLCDRVEQAVAEVKRLTPVTSVVVPTSGEIQSAAETYNKLVTFNDKLYKAEGAFNKVAPCMDVSVPIESTVSQGISALSLMKKFLADINTIGSEAQSISVEFKECSSELDKVESERATFKSCPLCGKDL